ncbi:unnamed protein product, partial [Brachionus calyciflorus]
MVLDTPIMLVGSPGVGKTSLIEALGRLTNNKVIRINLSEQTDLNELFGADLPIFDSNTFQQKFEWLDGPFLLAIEMNLKKKVFQCPKMASDLNNMLLIDARQIYGSDYQLLAASHENILLDSNTGTIINRLTGLKEDLSIESTNLARYDEVNVDVSFSTLDLTLKPETISEIIILIYGVYLNINKKENFSKNNLTNQEIKTSDLNSKINFNFNRITALMFKIEDDESARKVALFALDGVCVTFVLIPQ